MSLGVLICMQGLLGFSFYQVIKAVLIGSKLICILVGSNCTCLLSALPSSSSSSRDNLNTWPLSLRPSPRSIGIYTYFKGFAMHVYNDFPKLFIKVSKSYFVF